MQCAPGAPLELVGLWPAPSVSCAVLLGHVVGVAICAVSGVGWVLYDLVWWEQVVVVVPVPSFGWCERLVSCAARWLAADAFFLLAFA